MKNIFAMILILIILLFQGCKANYDIPPESDTYFRIKKDGVELNDTILLKSVLFYNNEKGVAISDPDDISEGGGDADDTAFMYLANSYKGGADFANSHIAFFRYVGSSITSGVPSNTYYLRYPDGDIDTLYILKEMVSNKQGQKERCYCTTPLRLLKFNGKDAIEDTSIHLSNGQPVYLFEK